MPHRHELRIRYAEVDVQGHVFDAHYLTYVDEAADSWFRAALGDDYIGQVDMVVKKVEVVWHGSAGFGDILAIEVGPRRWGTTSFDVGFAGSVKEAPVFEATATYVSVSPGTLDPTPVPDSVRAALG